MEAVMHIEAADKVYYCVLDVATKGFIKGKPTTPWISRITIPIRNPGTRLTFK